MERIVVVGGGAAGLISAIYAKKDDNEVIVLERNSICGKKILVTGNGRCNYFNEDQDLKYYNSNHKELLEQMMNPTNIQTILDFFKQIGIVPKIKNGYYYPSSNQASSIRNALVIEALRLGVQIKYDTLVGEITKVKKRFLLKLDQDQIEADKVILATGSKAAPKTGSDGNGYGLAEKFDHSIIEVVPSLVQLRSEEAYLPLWNGVRTDARLFLLEDNILVQEEYGEVQLTDYGISGICTFNLSSKVSRGLLNHQEEVVRIDFLPQIEIDNYKEFLTYFEHRAEFLVNRNMMQLLEGMLPEKLVEVILKKSHIDLNETWSQLETPEKKALYQNLKLFEIPITGVNSFDRAQVCSGGIPLIEINPLTMESKKEKGLYLVGELLDVDGCCGGYNLSFAWISGMIAGKGASFS